MEPATAMSPHGPKRRPPSLAALSLELITRLAAVAFVMTVVVVPIFFPWASDGPLTPAEKAELLGYYNTEFPDQGEASNEEETWHNIVKMRVAEFVQHYDVTSKKVLDVGAGRGYLQDAVADYTALDISPSAKRFYHKRFVVGSATLMPFADNEYDVAWTFFVLEHVQNPEAALLEIRRVVKGGGLIFLAPAWDVMPWAAQGYPARPYGDFNVGGKFVKASIPVQSYFWALSKPPVRLLRFATWKATSGPSRLRYRRLTPNYKHYWMADSDAVNSLDRYETALWFLSRGDDCLNCAGALDGLLHENDALIIRVHKSSGPAYARTGE